jgi:hypothetical protein
MVKPFKESHSKDLEKLPPDNWCEEETKETHDLSKAPMYIRNILCCP